MRWAPERTRPKEELGWGWHVCRSSSGQLSLGIKRDVIRIQRAPGGSVYAFGAQWKSRG